MPIADLFSASALPKAVGTGRNGRNAQQIRAIELFRPTSAPVGTVGTAGPVKVACSDCSDPSPGWSEQKIASKSGHVPTVPTVPTQKSNAVGEICRHCDLSLAWPGPAGIVLGDGTAECQRCADDEVWRLLEAGRRVVESPDARADPAEVMLRGELI